MSMGDTPRLDCGRPACDQLEQVLRSCGTVLYPHLHSHTRRQLRLVCKAACDAVDANTRCLTFVGKTNGRSALSFSYPGRPNTKSLQIKQPRPLATQMVIAHTLLYKSLGTYTMGFDFSSSLPPRLQRLCLTDCLTWPLGDSLAPLTSFAPTLQHLALSHNKLCNAASCTALAGVLSTLTSLHMERNRMQGLLGLALAPALPALNQLTRLELVEEDVSESTPQLLRAITGLPQLQHLRLNIGTTRRWGDEAPAWDSTSLDAALVMLKGLPSLTFLDLGQDCGAMCCTYEVDSPTGHICRDMQRLCKAVAAVSTLTSLHLNHLRLEGSIGLLAAHFPAALFPAPVHTLSLVKCHLTGHGEQLCQALSALPGITSLDLSENRFTRQDWQHLGPALALAGLRHAAAAAAHAEGAGRLGLLGRTAWYSLVQPASGTVLQPGTAWYSTVRPHSETPGADALSDALPHLCDLRVLNLENSIRLAEGAARLLPAIGRLGASLEELDLQWCFLGADDVKQEAVPALTQMLPKLTRLRTLRVQQNDFDPQHTIDVLASLPVDLRELEMEVALDWERQAQATVLSGLARLRRLTHLRFDPGFWYPDAMLRTFDSLTELQRLTIRQDSASYASVSRWGAWWIRMFFELKHRVMRAKKQIARLEAAWEKLPGLEVDICQGREGVLLRSSVRMGAS